MKDNNDVTGRGRITCPFYDEIDAILGTRAASRPPVLLDSGKEGVAVEESEICSDNENEQGPAT